MDVEDIEAQDIDEPVKEKITKAKAIIVKDSTGAMMPRDHVQLMVVIDQMINAGAVPKHLKNRLQVLAAWNFAAQLKLPPQPSLRNIAVIEGNPMLFGDLPLSLAQRHSDYISHDEFCINEAYERISFENKNLNEKIFGGVCLMQRKGMKESKSYSFTINDANRAGLIRRAKAGMPWISYPQVMFVRRARAMALKAHFADALCGAGIAEYDQHRAPDLENLREVNQEVENARSFIDELE